MNSWKKNFFIIWTGQGISILSTSIIQMSIVWYLTDQTKSATVLTMATLAGYLPQILFGPFLGVLIDKYSRKVIMILADLFISLVTSCIVISGFLGEIPIPLIFGVLIFRSLGTAVHNPCINSITPLLVPKEELTRYAGITQGIESVSMLVSPGLAALCYGLWPLHKVAIIDILGALLAVVTVLLVTIPKVAQVSKGENVNIIRETVEGFQIIKKERGLLGLIIISSLYAIIYFPMGNLFLLIVMTYFGGSFADSGVVETIFCIGMLAGSFILSISSKKLNKMAAITGSIGLYGLCIMLTGLLPPSGLRIFWILTLFVGLSIPFYRGLKMSILQSKIQAEYLGRVIALTNSMQNLAVPIGLISAGVFAQMMGISRWFILSGVLSLVLAVVSCLLPSVRRYCNDPPRKQ